MSKQVKLQYFKFSGKYYSEGAYKSDAATLFDVIDEVRAKLSEGNLPGLVKGAKDFIVLIDSEVPQLVIPLWYQRG